MDDRLLWDGCTNHSKLLVVAQMFTIKLDHRLSEANYEKKLNGQEAFYLKGTT